MNYSQNSRGFSLIEILVVLGLMIFLFGSFFYFWNTSQVFKKGRDSRRISDLQALDAAIKNLLVTQSDLNLGQENIIYLSLPDSSSTCGSYSLNKISSPFSYRCQTITNYLKTDGNGWLPINFASGSVIVLSSLPKDPLNNADYFYAYQVKNGRYKLTARFEDKSFIEKMVSDGGLELTLYEVGSDLRIPSPQSGLVLYLPFDEGTGTVAYDSSGYGNNGTLYSSSTICSNPPTSGCPQWINAKVGKALSFDGVDDYVTTSVQIDQSFSGLLSYTFCAWAKTNETSINRKQIISTDNGGYDWSLLKGDGSNWNIFSGNGVVRSYVSLDLNWHYLCGVWDRKSSLAYIYVDGKFKNSGSLGLENSYCSLNIARNPCFSGGSEYFNGYIDEVRIYNRPLSADEIKVIYEATK